MTGRNVLCTILSIRVFIVVGMSVELTAFSPFGVVQALSTLCTVCSARSK